MPRASSPGADSQCYPNRMAKPKKFDLENPAPVVDDEDEETLAAIDGGTRDAEAGRTVPAEEAQRLLLELHAYQNALVRKGIAAKRRGQVVSHEEVVKRMNEDGECSPTVEPPIGPMTNLAPEPSPFFHHKDHVPASQISLLSRVRMII